MHATMICIHGFNSSPASFKARLLRERLAALGRKYGVIAQHQQHQGSAATPPEAGVSVIFTNAHQCPGITETKAAG